MASFTPYAAAVSQVKKLNFDEQQQRQLQQQPRQCVIVSIIVAPPPPQCRCVVSSSRKCCCRTKGAQEGRLKGSVSVASGNEHPETLLMLKLQAGIASLC